MWVFKFTWFSLENRTYFTELSKKTTIDLPSWQILLKTWRISNALRTTGSGWNAFGVSRTTPSKLLTLCRTKFCYDRGKIIIRQLVSVHSSSPKLNQMESTWLDSEWVFFRLLVTWIERFSENHLWFSPRALFSINMYIYILMGLAPFSPVIEYSLHISKLYENLVEVFV